MYVYCIGLLFRFSQGPGLVVACIRVQCGGYTGAWVDLGRDKKCHNAVKSFIVPGILCGDDGVEEKITSSTQRVERRRNEAQG